MDRRDFLKLAGIAGFSVVTPFAPRVARADITPYEGTFWVTVHAGGGWDPTMVCDPKGRRNEDHADPINNFFVDEIVEVGPFALAPVDAVVSFFRNHQDQILAINGIDSATVSHEVGRRNTWSGGLTEELPALSALVAGATDSTLPLSFISNGGYDFTDELVAPTRVANTDVLSRVAFPHRLSAGDPSTNLFTDATIDRIADARTARHERLMDASTLPREQQALNTLFEARQGTNDLRRLVDALPGELDNSNNALRRQAQVAIASYKAGLTVSANLTVGGFDTHSNHDVAQGNAITRLFEGLSFLMEEAERQDVLDQMVVIVGSDFGRTPRYNDGNGKDHWSVTSMLALGQGIRGNRVIGGTDDGQGPLTVDPGNLELSSSGIRISPAHVNDALRRHAGIDEHPLVAPYPLRVEALDFFS